MIFIIAMTWNYFALAEQVARRAVHPGVPRTLSCALTVDKVGAGLKLLVAVRTFLRSGNFLVVEDKSNWPSNLFE